MAATESWDAQLCVKRCGFFGAPWTEGMCSKCYHNRDNISLALLREPLSPSDGEAPVLHWFQRSSCIYIIIHMPDIKDVVVGFDDDDKISLNMTSTGRPFVLRALTLFAPCSISRSTMKCRNDEILVTLAKQKRKWWDFLSCDRRYKKQIKANREQWRDEEDSDYEDEDRVSSDDESSREEDDESHPRFRMWEAVKHMESGDKPLSPVFDAIDGFQDSELASSRRPHVVPEFKKAAKTMCLSDTYIAHSRFSRYLLEMEQAMDSDPSLRTHLMDPEHFDNLAAKLVQHAYRLNCVKEAQMQRSLVPQCSDTFMPLPPSTQRPYNVLKDLYAMVTDAGKLKLAYALELMLKHDQPDSLVAKLSELVDRVPRCNSAKKQAFNMLFTHAFRCKEIARPTLACDVTFAGDTSTLREQVAREHVQRCFESFLDDHKERAFSSAFVEPSRLYFHAIGDYLSFEVIRQHGINWYLVLIHEGLGMSMPFLPDYNDQFGVGLADFWAGLKLDVWNIFADPSAFGMEFQGIQQFRQLQFGSAKFVLDPHLASEFPKGVQTQYPRHLARALSDVGSKRCALLRHDLALYLERFAYFFSREFFVTKAIESLNAELKPEYVGFRKAFAILFESYKRAEGLGDVDVDTYCYKDEYYTQLDVERVEKIFAWLGFVKGPKTLDTCQICYEDRYDVEILDHWETKGDVSEHKMCSDCYAQLGKNECPFCKEVLLKEEFVKFIDEFIDSAQRNATAQQHVQSLAESVAVANRSAQMLERWQLFEMEHDGNPRVVRRVAKLIIEELGDELQRATAAKSDWLRDIAGVVFRLHAFVQESEVTVRSDHTSALAAAVECILAPFEQEVPRDHGYGPWEGHYYGHLYNQVLVAWLCAFRSNVADSVLRDITRRVGRGIVRSATWYEERGEKQGIRNFVAEVMHSEYILLSHEPCWGSQKDDIVWQTFCSADQRVSSIQSAASTTVVRL
eukprot:TRINITY_DN683_c5_g1_i2.p1 TRINITY_DN683_c5_g1~~TRINITY_DN683_c5_g1_i2.p1  ORF type:complete len:974 (-),score=121.29 TRINITY_DN683_c5_g1_i2:100-2994(-)